MWNASVPYKTDRLPMNIHLLNVLRHRISELYWSPYSKQVFWTACTVCFFTSCRMGELVPERENSVDPVTTLTWGNDKQIDDNEFILFIPYSKTTGFRGKVVDIFKIKGNKNCPALRRLRKMTVSSGGYYDIKPVFSFSSGKNLTKNKINSWLANLLEDFVDSNHKITGHSFRAGIPSTLACFPDDYSVKIVKEWGMWESDSYALYTKREWEGKRARFGRIVKSLYSY